MTVRNVLLSAITACVTMGGAASAAVVGIDADCGGLSGTMLGSNYGTGSVVCSGDASRSDVGKINIIENGPVAGDDKFFSLGLGGSLVIEFDRGIAGSTSAIEITSGSGVGHGEAAEVYGSNDGVNFDLLGLVTNRFGQSIEKRGYLSTVSFTGTYTMLGFLDVSQREFAGTASFDGYDLDAVSVSAVPLPASAMLLIAGLGGLGLMRRRSN